MTSLYKFWFGNDILIRQIRIDGIIESTSPLRIGAGKAPKVSATVDLPIMMIRYILNNDEIDLPVIPGSSIKGVFRNYAVKLAKMKNIKVCQGIPKNTCMDENAGDISLSKKLQNYLKDRMDEEAKKLVKDKVCILCKIFGSPNLLSKVYFSDAIPLNKNGKIMNFKIGVKAGIAIDRKTGTTKKQALYFVEYVEPGSRFFWEITGFNLPNYALGLLAQELLDLDSGLIRVGGFKSRGFGRVKIVELKVNIEDFNGKSGFLKAIDEYDEEIEIEGNPSESTNDAFKLLRKLANFWWKVKLPVEG